MSEELEGYDPSCGKLYVAEFEYLAELFGGANLNVENLNNWLVKKACDGWQLVSVSKGVHYFRRERYRIYQEVASWMVERKLGENA
jgi:hypothetical protein